MSTSSAIRSKAATIFDIFSPHRLGEGESFVIQSDREGGRRTYGVHKQLNFSATPCTADTREGLCLAAEIAFENECVTKILQVIESVKTGVFSNGAEEDTSYLRGEIQPTYVRVNIRQVEINGIVDIGYHLVRESVYLEAVRDSKFYGPDHPDKMDIHVLVGSNCRKQVAEIERGLRRRPVMRDVDRMFDVNIIYSMDVRLADKVIIIPSVKDFQDGHPSDLRAGFLPYYATAVGSELKVSYRPVFQFGVIGELNLNC